MHCPNCGKETAAEVKFCRACGMKLDSVALAVSEHKGEHKGGQGLTAPDEHERDARAVRNIVFPMATGLIIVFIGAMLSVLGKQIDPWVKTVGAMIALFGVFVTIFGAMYSTIRESSRAIRKPPAKGETGKELDESPAGVLPSGDDFEPASQVAPVSSVTEGTTRNLDGEKTKVIR